MTEALSHYEVTPSRPAIFTSTCLFIPSVSKGATGTIFLQLLVCLGQDQTTTLRTASRHSTPKLCGPVHTMYLHINVLIILCEIAKKSSVENPILEFQVQELVREFKAWSRSRLFWMIENIMKNGSLILHLRRIIILYFPKKIKNRKFWFVCEYSAIKFSSKRDLWIRETEHHNKLPFIPG